MKIGIVISGGDVSGINNFIFQIARLADAEITLFNGGIPGLLEKIIMTLHGVIWSIFLSRQSLSLPREEQPVSCSVANMKRSPENSSRCILMC